MYVSVTLWTWMILTHHGLRQPPQVSPWAKRKLGICYATLGPCYLFNDYYAPPGQYELRLYLGCGEKLSWITLDFILYEGACQHVLMHCQRVNTNYELIASWGGWQRRTGDPRILETPLAAHCCSQRPNHLAMTHPPKAYWYQLGSITHWLQQRVDSRLFVM